MSGWTAALSGAVDGRPSIDDVTAVDGPKTYAVVSLGLWRQRRDLSRLLGAAIVAWPFARPGRVDGFVGWGRKPSGERALRLAARAGKEAVTLEDGFLRGFAPGSADPPHSYVIDRTGIYFDARRPSGLDALLADPVRDAAQLARARALIDLLRRERLSKYNNSLLLSLEEAGLPRGRPFVLLVDQVAGDASIAGAGVGPERFRDMLKHAAEAYPGRLLVVRTHPAAGDRSLLRRAAADLGLDIIVPPRMNPWPLLEEAEAVHTVSSQLGFEALMAGRTVHCFGTTYYSGRGLTVDHMASPAERAPASLEQVFHAAFLDYSHYLDLHTREPCAMERAVEQALAVRDQRCRLPKRVFTAGLSAWKRKAMTGFLTGLAGPPVHFRWTGAAERAAAAADGVVAVWGSDRPLPGASGLRIEDGFIRSRGLGVTMTLPSSVAIDGAHIYYDARGESRLEALIARGSYDEALKERARRLAHLLVRRGVSKYNLGTAAELPAVEAGRLRILVPGQVEKDASIRFGSPAVRSNAGLVRAVRALYPEAFIAYKEHPDVTSGMRSGGETPDAADLIVRSGDILHWIGWADRIETMTSLAGFEALLRGKPVGTHGAPFYAGWGLTDDRLAISRRERRIDLETLVAASLILYPFYVHPLSRLPCRPEDLVEEIATPGAVRRPNVLEAAWHDVVMRVSRLEIRWRDRRR